MQTPDLSDKQFASVRDSDGRVNLWHGSIRSGKTIGSLLRWMLFVAATLTKSGDLVMFGRTRDSVWRNCIGPMQDPNLFGPIAAQVRGNYGAPTVTILGRRVYVIGAHDVQAELVLRGLTVLGAYGDEITTIPEGFFLQMLGRMSTPWSRLFGTTNPDSPGHWLKKMIDRALPDWRVFHFVIDDNPSLLSSYVEAIKREYTGLWYRRFILGEWVVAEGAVYDSWDERLVVEPDQIPATDRVLTVGVDYGTTNAIEDLREGRDEWREVATQNASEKIRLCGELSVERERHARTREGLSNVGADLLKAYMVDMPQVALSAYAAGKESMRASAVTACRVAYRTGMTNGFKAAQQLFTHQLGLAVGVGRAQGRVFGDRQAIGLAVHGCR